MENNQLIENFIFSCLSYNPSMFYYAFEKICQNKIVLTEENLNVLFKHKICFDQHCYYVTNLLYLIEQYNYYEKNLYNFIIKTKDKIYDKCPKKYVQQWLLKSKKYAMVQFHKNKKYKNKLPITMCWYNSKILEPKLVGIIGSYL